LFNENLSISKTVLPDYPFRKRFHRTILFRKRFHQTTLFRKKASQTTQFQKKGFTKLPCFKKKFSPTTQLLKHEMGEIIVRQGLTILNRYCSGFRYQAVNQSFIVPHRK